MTAIQQVSPSLYEAAEMDGAGKIRQFFYITVPSIRPTFWYILMTRFAGAPADFRYYLCDDQRRAELYDRVHGKLHLHQGVASNSSMGYASAMSVILFIVIMFITVLMYRRMNREE